MQQQEEHPLGNETAVSLLEGLDKGQSVDPNQSGRQVIPIGRQRKNKNQPQSVEPPPIQYEQPQGYYEQQIDSGQPYPTTYTPPAENPETRREEEPNRKTVTISSWRLQGLESVATVSGSTLFLSLISLSPLGSIALSLSPQWVLGLAGTSILVIGFLGELPLPGYLNRHIRKATTILLGIVLGYVFWWAIASRTPVILSAPFAPAPFTQPAPR